ncbi:MAG: sarcosine oxidase subunit alpha family protein [Proteobacteria bacterium]|nr:sarcosine oxidase subunit alpha family protein [Pseudomonadota bacterium]
MSQPFRLDSGGAIDRSIRLGFSFDGRSYEGHGGDTLASALIANGVKLVGRSFKYHRPRGIVSAGPEEPNALVGLRTGARAEPNTRATMVELYDGLVAESQNRWPSLAFDLGAVSNLISPLFPAGFYYKTFMWPPSAWLFYERFIRKAAGMGKAAMLPDPDHYEHRFAHCDVLVIGGGPAGILAAREAARSNARVILVDERAAMGGAFRFERLEIDGMPARIWAETEVAALGTMPEVRLLPRTTAFGYYDHNEVALVERVADHLAVPPPHTARQRLWHVRAKQVVLATGAIERPLVFANNDTPGVMLASAVRRYLGEYAVVPGRLVVVATNNDDAYLTALDLAAAKTVVATVIDARPRPTGSLIEATRRAGIAILAGHVVIAAAGGRGLKQIQTGRIDDAGRIVGSGPRLAADLLAVSGGWTPTIHLHSQSGGKLRFDEALAAFVPDAAKQACRVVGAANGTLTLAAGLAEAAAAGAEAARACGFGSGQPGPLPAVPLEESGRVRALWQAGEGKARAKQFVDLQDDVTVNDVALAHRENFRSVEHLKRYTTLGMGTDQGKTSNLAGLAILAELRGEPIAAVGTTTFRPPYTPVALGTLVGPEVGLHVEPIRRTPMHDWHVAHHALMYETGPWLRPRAYPKPGESFDDAWLRETLAVRGGVGLVDVSTLGKIDVQGPDAAEFLDRIYCNTYKTLAVGRARYGLMLREDGIVFDDGTTSRLSETSFYMTTTTASAAKVMSHLEYYLQVVWPELKVAVTSITEQWAQMALAGPRCRAVLERAVTGCDVGNTALPYMGVRDGKIAGIPVRIFRLSFSGELAYEIGAPADYGTAVWEALLEAGAALRIVPYGLEAMGTMRIEKGHVAGPELDGRTTPGDLGLGRMVSKKKPFVGSRLLERPALQDPGRMSLVGLVPADGTSKIRAGAQLIAEHGVPPLPMLGHVTSVTGSPSLGHPIALALLKGGLSHKGRTVIAAVPMLNESVVARVVEPVFYDPEGARLHA